jgi:hypothetical protein
MKRAMGAKRRNEATTIAEKRNATTQTRTPNIARTGETTREMKATRRIER